MQSRLKTLAAAACAIAGLLGIGAILTAKAAVAQFLAGLTVVVCFGLAWLLVAATTELAGELERKSEEAARARTRQISAMQEQKEIQERWRQVEFLSNILKAIASLRDVDSVLDAVLDRVMDFFAAGSAYVLLGDPDEGDLIVQRAKARDGEAVIEGRVKWGEGIAGRVALTGEPVLRGPGNPAYANKPPLMCVPLRSEGRSIGCLMVEQRDKGYFSKGDLSFLSLLGQEISLAIERARLYTRMEQMSITDPLTKLSNRRYFDSRLTEEIARAKRHQRTLCVIMLDIDHFKHVNDTYGHPMGDTVLKGVAQLIRKHARSTDLPARYGGEEFILVCTDTTREDAVVLAERLRQTMEEAEFVGEGENQGLVLHITVSLGVAAFPEDAQEPNDLVERADEALYQAKKSGRNRVCVYERT